MDLLSRDGKGSTTAFSGVQDIGLHILKRNGGAAAAPGSFVARDFRAPKIFRPTAIPLKICKPARIFSESFFTAQLSPDGFISYRGRIKTAPSSVWPHFLQRL
jgi:hypothetical protein